MRAEFSPFFAAFRLGVAALLLLRARDDGAQGAGQQGGLQKEPAASGIPTVRLH